MTEVAKDALGHAGRNFIHLVVLHLFRFLRVLRHRIVRLNLFGDGVRECIHALDVELLHLFIGAEHIRLALADFLNRVYYDLRNLGKTSHDRALNFGVTNAFQAMQAFTDPLVRGMQLDSIHVEKSPFCRMDSDCWDVKLRFFDPENNLRAKRIIRYTIDVSDLIPVTMGEPRTWTTAD